MNYLGIFIRTFAALAAAVLVAAQGYSWASDVEFRANALLIGLGLLAAAIGALVAVGWALVQAPATTALAKAVRAGVEKIVGGIGAIAFNEVADVVVFGKLLPPLLIAAAFAFVITLLSYVSPPVTEPT